MIQLADVFQNGMVLQYGNPVRLWGVCNAPQWIEVRLNGSVILVQDVAVGNFTLTLPPQPAMENAELRVGEICLTGVDFGEVWLAGGQSNMEFLLQYDQEGAAEIELADDLHFRCYTVGQYTCAGQREKYPAIHRQWDCWLPFTPDHAATFTAVGSYFARKLRRELGVPVGIVSCNMGGTSVCTWLDPARLDTPTLRSYLDEYEAQIARLEEAKSRREWEKQATFQANTATDPMDHILKNTLTPQQFRAMLEQLSGAGVAVGGDTAFQPLGRYDKNRPGGLYETMVSRIAGFTMQGILWYQGETDALHAECYTELLTALIENWRALWDATLPFLAVQLAPFGTWLSEAGQAFPTVRRCQQIVSESVPEVYLISSSDCGNVYDIHPKHKRPIGERLADAALQWVYGAPIDSSAPLAESCSLCGDMVSIAFVHGGGLHFTQKEWNSYNGFVVSDIDPQYLPPILGGINGLEVETEAGPLPLAECSCTNNVLTIRSKVLAFAERVTVRFAQTQFYEVNLLNAHDLPAFPFVLQAERRSRPPQKETVLTSADLAAGLTASCFHDNPQGSR